MLTAMSHPLATVGALVRRPDRRVLLVRTHKWRDTWGVPGGKIDYGETIKAALEREFLEETGLRLARVFWGPVQEAVRSPEFFRDAHFILLNFIALTDDEHVILNGEAQEHAWVTAEDALTFDLNTPTRRLLEFYRAHLPLGENLPCL